MLKRVDWGHVFFALALAGMTYLWAAAEYQLQDCAATLKQAYSQERTSHADQ